MRGDPWMDEAEFKKAKANREAQLVVYPKGTEETEESREKRRVQQKSVSPKGLNFVPVYDPRTKKVKWS